MRIPQVLQKESSVAVPLCRLVIQMVLRSFTVWAVCVPLVLLSSVIARGSEDCNANGVSDNQDIALGTSIDEDQNGVPDECEAGQLYVDINAPDGGDGLSWSTAYNDLQRALDVAGNSSTYQVTVKVAEGVYTPAGPGGDRTAAFVLKRRVRVMGGFPAGGVSRPDTEVYETILSGDLNGDDGPITVRDAIAAGIAGNEPDGLLVSNLHESSEVVAFQQANHYGDNSFRIIEADSECRRAELYNLTITGAFGFDSTLPSTDYFTVDVRFIPVTIKDCLFDGNYSFDGGVLCGCDSDLLIMESRFQFNGAKNIFTESSHSSLTLNGVEVFKNAAHHNLIQLDAMEVILTDCQIHGNLSNETIIDAVGEQIEAQRCTFQANTGGVFWVEAYGDRNGICLSDCLFQNNITPEDDLVRLESKDIAIERCVFSGNHADEFAGAAIDDCENLSMRDCSFVSNISDNSGVVNLTTMAGEIEDCCFENNSASRGYGGVMLEAGNAQFSRCQFTGNHASSRGAAIGTSSYSDSFTLFECDFIDNVSDYYGGAVFSRSRGECVVDHCSFRGNFSNDGGAIHHTERSASFTIRNSEFFGNIATHAGAVMCRGLVTVEDCTFNANWGHSAGALLVGYGDSVARTSDMSDAELPYIGSVSHCIFSGNAATDCGGLLLSPRSIRSFSSDTLFPVSDCTFVGNTAADSAGAVAGQGSLSNCLFVGNGVTGQEANGAVMSLLSNSVVRNCTFLNNGANGSEYISVPSYEPVDFANCIFADVGGAPIFNDGEVNVTYSCLREDWAGEGNINADPKFIPQVSGTWTESPHYDPRTGVITLYDAHAAWTDDVMRNGVVNPDTTQDVYLSIVSFTANSVSILADFQTVSNNATWVGNGATYEIVCPVLASTSPCIDAGTNEALMADNHRDLQGNSRRWDDPQTADTGFGVAPIVDMGAYEYGSHQTGDMNCDGYVDLYDINAFVQVLVNADQYAVDHPGCSSRLADVNSDGNIDVFDIDSFVKLLVNSR